ncbi:colanic acid biosynthesis glycosyltransferase WcaE [Clavibacter sp. VKM Ac-2873]|nr:glycosyltransferase [Clavibacter sp. VKM Ac-2873]MBF4616710.1 colanic acid biosynthesis glycosyltransferase WcaE [Clavibacter sp. VKM Ac-2873]
MPVPPPLLSVVVVTFRDLPGLGSTLGSVRQLVHDAGDAIEVIVVDGGTGEGLHDVVTGSGVPVDLSSGPDDGIYDAMNAGIARSTGRFVWFLNGGDRSHVESWELLSGILRAAGDDELLLGDYLLDTGHGEILRKARPPFYIHHGLPTSHQAILYPGSRIRGARYDLRFRVVGDYELTARLLRSGVRPVVVHVPLAVFAAGGMSQVRAKEIAVEAARVQTETLRTPAPVRWASRALHTASRIRRTVQTS